MRIVYIAFVISIALNFVAMGVRADWLIIPAALFGWALADMGSGLVHMLMDYIPFPPSLELDRIYFHPRRGTAEYTELKNRLLKRAGPFYRLVFDFKCHHPRPDTLGTRSFEVLAGPTLMLVALPLSLVANAAAFVYPLPGWALAFAISLSIGAGLSQYFHSTLHRPQPPAVILVLRRIGLLMTPRAHQIHHDSLNQDFAVITGWSNPIINLLFRLLHSRGVLKDDGLEPPRGAASLAD